ncbi:MAG TPA: hypothetical protein VF122_06065 [Caulobacteraceae bacterium]
MRATIGIALIAALAAAPAIADDRVFSERSASVLTENYVGSPLWSLLASCAGAEGAAHAYYAQGSKTVEAEQSKVTGVRYLNLATARLVADRGPERQAALEMVAPVVELGRDTGLSALAYPGGHKSSQWLAIRTSCEEIAAGA